MGFLPKITSLPTEIPEMGAEDKGSISILFSKLQLTGVSKA